MKQRIRITVSLSKLYEKIMLLEQQKICCSLIALHEDCALELGMISGTKIVEILCNVKCSFV